MRSGTSLPLRSAIIGLLFCGGPFAVFRAIPEVVIYPVKGLAIRSRPHVETEVLKGAKPSLAYSDTSSSVVLESYVSGSEAAVYHTAPRIPLGTPPHAMSGIHLHCDAPARFRISAAEVRQLYFPLDAAGTSADSERVFAVFPPGDREHGEPAKFLANAIFSLAPLRRPWFLFKSQFELFHNSLRLAASSGDTVLVAPHLLS
jgi:hypothetical protein